MRFAAAAVTAKEDFQPQDENPGAAILCASRLEDLASHFGVATIELCEEDEAVWDQVGQSAGSCVGRALRILRSCEGSLPNDVFTEAFNGPPEALNSTGRSLEESITAAKYLVCLGANKLQDWTSPQMDDDMRAFGIRCFQVNDGFATLEIEGSDAVRVLRTCLVGFGISLLTRKVMWCPNGGMKGMKDSEPHSELLAASRLTPSQWKTLCTGGTQRQSFSRAPHDSHSSASGIDNVAAARNALARYFGKVMTKPKRTTYASWESINRDLQDEEIKHYWRYAAVGTWSCGADTGGYLSDVMMEKVTKEIQGILKCDVSKFESVFRAVGNNRKNMIEVGKYLICLGANNLGTGHPWVWRKDRAKMTRFAKACFKVSKALRDDDGLTKMLGCTLALHGVHLALRGTLFGGIRTGGVCFLAKEDCSKDLIEASKLSTASVQTVKNGLSVSQDLWTRREGPGTPRRATTESPTSKRALPATPREREEGPRTPMSPSGGSQHDEEIYATLLDIYREPTGLSLERHHDPPPQSGCSDPVAEGQSFVTRL